MSGMRVKTINTPSRKPQKWQVADLSRSLTTLSFPIFYFRQQITDKYLVMYRNQQRTVYTILVPMGEIVKIIHGWKLLIRPLYFFTEI